MAMGFSKSVCKLVFWKVIDSLHAAGAIMLGDVCWRSGSAEFLHRVVARIYEKASIEMLGPRVILARRNFALYACMAGNGGK